MILLNDNRLAVSFGWTDRLAGEPASLWTYDIATKREAVFPLSDAWSIQLVEGSEDHFAVVHKPEKGEGAMVCVHTAERPQEPVARLTFSSSGLRFEGDREAWIHVPRQFVIYRGIGEDPEPHFLVVVRDGVEAELQRMDWFNSDHYGDLGYHSVLDAIEIPGSHLLLMPVQRDSRPTIYDPILEQKVGEIRLARGVGTPRLRFRKTRAELWADDYDTLLRLDPSDWSVMDLLELHPHEGIQHWFFGAFSFSADESLCVVPRPFKGDVLALSTETFAVTQIAEIGGQPIEAALLPDGTLLVREQTRGLVETTFRPWDHLDRLTDPPSSDLEHLT